MSEVQQELNEPGKILRTAREELGLSVDQVADQLHLRPSVVEALEKEDYSEFTSDVFLKGYFRSYCRLVNLHESRMVELLDHSRELAGFDPGMKKDSEAEYSSVLQRNWFKLFVAALIGLVLIGAAWSVWQGMDAGSPVLEGAAPAEQVATQNPESETETETETGVRLPFEQRELGDSPVQRANEETVSQLPESSTYAVEEQQREESQVSSQAEVDQPEATQAEQGDLSGEAAPETVASVQEASDTAMTLSIVFTGDCWLQVKGASGNTLKAALQRAGSEAVIESQENLNVVLGDARQAQVYVNGKMFDVAPYTARNGRAQFRLDLKTF